MTKSYYTPELEQIVEGLECEIIDAEMAMSEAITALEAKSFFNMDYEPKQFWKPCVLTALQAQMIHLNPHTIKSIRVKILSPTIINDRYKVTGGELIHWDGSKWVNNNNEEVVYPPSNDKILETLGTDVLKGRLQPDGLGRYIDTYNETDLNK